MSVVSRRPRLVDEVNRHLPDVSDLATQPGVGAAHRADPAPAPETEGAGKILSGYRKHLAPAKIRAARPRRAGPSTPNALREILATLGQTDAVETKAGRLVTPWRRALKRNDKVAMLYIPPQPPALCGPSALLVALNTRGALMSR